MVVNNRINCRKTQELYFSTIQYVLKLKIFQRLWEIFALAVVLMLRFVMLFFWRFSVALLYSLYLKKQITIPQKGNYFHIHLKALYTFLIYYCDITPLFRI